MASIGSVVIHSGQKWINQVSGTQPVWGVKKSSRDDESAKSPKGKGLQKNFDEMLKDEIKRKKF